VPLAVLQIEEMGVQAWVGTLLRVAPIPDGQALETDRGRFTVDRHGEGTNVVPIDEAIAHEFMGGDRFLIEPTMLDHPLSHDLYSDLDKVTEFRSSPKRRLNLITRFKITTAKDESDSAERCRGADTATCG
jgi:hypothetical protein